MGWTKCTILTFWCIRASLTCCRDAENESMILWLGPACWLTPACAAPARSDASMLLPVCVGVRPTHIPHIEGDPVPAGSFAWARGRKEPLCVWESFTQTHTHRHGAIYASFVAGRRRREDTSSRGAQVLLMAALLHQKSKQRFLMHLWSAERRITSVSSSTQQQMHAGKFVHMHAYYATLSWQVDDKP